MPRKPQHPPAERPDHETVRPEAATSAAPANDGNDRRPGKGKKGSGGRARGKTKGPAKPDLSLWTPELQQLHERALPLAPRLEALDRKRLGYRELITVLLVQMFIGVGRCPERWPVSALRLCGQRRRGTRSAIEWIEQNLDRLSGMPQTVELTLRKALDG